MTCGEIAGIVVGTITAIGVFVGPIVAIKFQRSHVERREALKNHFQMLADGLLLPLAECTREPRNNRGELSLRLSPTGSESGKRYVEDVDLQQDKLYSSFRLHFPIQAKEFELFRNSYLNHYKELEQFNLELEKLILEKTGLSFKSNGQKYYIESSTVDCLRLTLYQHVRKEPILHDFREAEIHKGDDFYRLHDRNLQRYDYAFTLSEEDSENLKSTLIELMERIDLQQRELKIVQNAEKLKNESNLLSKQLYSTYQNYSNLGNTLKWLKDCSICKVMPFNSFSRLLFKK